MKWTRMIVAAVLAAAMPNPAAAGDASADSAATRPITLPTPALDGLRTQNYYLRDLEGVPPGHLNLSLSMSSMQWYAPPTRFDAVMQGAGAAATLGLFLGAVGNTLSWFDEETTWWITGGLAAAGAAYGGATYQQPDNGGLRIKWSVGDDK